MGRIKASSFKVFLVNLMHMHLCDKFMLYFLYFGNVHFSLSNVSEIRVLFIVDLMFWVFSPKLLGQLCIFKSVPLK